MNFVFYARTNGCENEGKNKIQNQIDYGKRYCTLNNIEISHMYLDEGVSGNTPFEKRERGGKLLEDAKNKKFDTVIVYKLDKLGRSTKVVLEVLKKFEEYGIRLYSVTDEFDTTTAAGKGMIHMLAAIADMEREEMSMRIRASFRAKRVAKGV